MKKHFHARSGFLHHGCLILFLAACLSSTAAFGQLQIQFAKSQGSWDNIFIAYRLTCSGSPMYLQDTTHLKVFDEGREVLRFTHTIPPLAPEEPVGVFMVMNTGPGMTSQLLDSAKLRAHEIINHINAPNGGAVYSISDTLEILQDTTRQVQLLHSAVDSFRIQSGPATWDDVYQAIETATQYGPGYPYYHPRMILFSNASILAGTYSVIQCIGLANQRRIRVFIAGYGSFDDPDLIALANMTGCRYTRNLYQLLDVFDIISAIVWTSPDPETISFLPFCPDGTNHDVTVEITNVCNSSVTATTKCHAPKDTSVFESIRVLLGSGSVRGNDLISIPLLLADSLRMSAFYPATFDVLFEGQALSYLRHEIKPTALLSGIPLDITSIIGGIRIQTHHRIPHAGAGELLSLVFKALDRDPNDTLCTPLRLTNWVFEAGCARPVTQNGSVCIVPRSPALSTTIDEPSAVAWDEQSQSLNPATLTLNIHTQNSGDCDATGIRYRIVYDSSSFDLVSPPQDVIVPGVPTIGPGKEASVAWKIKPRTRLTGDSVIATVIVSAGNHPDVASRRAVWIPQTGPIPSVSLTAPTSLSWSKQIHDYNENPFEVLMRISNAGATELTHTSATLTFNPQDFEMASGSIPTKTPLRSTIRYNETADIIWNLRARPRASGDSASIRFVTHFGNHSDVLSESKLWIPPSDSKLFCTVESQTVTRNADGSRYALMPFMVRATVQSLTDFPSDTIFVTISLPPELSLAGGSTQTQVLSPPVLKQNDTGTVSWMLMHAPQAKDATYPFSVTVTSRSVDTVHATGTVSLPGLAMPQLQAWCTLPDTIQYDDTTATYLPDPFDVSLAVRNIGVRSLQNIRATIILPPDFRLADTTQPLTRDIIPNLDPAMPGAQPLVSTWQVRVAFKRKLPRLRNIEFDIAGLDSVYNTEQHIGSACHTIIKGTQSNVLFVTLPFTNPDTIRHDATGTALTMHAVPWRVVLANTGKNPQTIRYVRLDISGDGVGLDATTPGLHETDLRLSNKDTAVFVWCINIEPKSTARSITLYASAYDDALLAEDIQALHIQAVAPTATCNLGFSDSSLLFDAARRIITPEKWIVASRLRNTGEIPLSNVVATLTWPDGNIASFNPDSPGNENPRRLDTLRAGASQDFSWNMMISKNFVFSKDTVVPLHIEYAADESTPGWSCTGTIHIRSTAATEIGHIASSPETIAFLQNYPNPADNATTISFFLPAPQPVRLTLYDMFGRAVREMEHGPGDMGWSSLTLHIADLPQGMYFYMLDTPSTRVWKRMLILR